MVVTAPAREQWVPATPEQRKEILGALAEVLASSQFANSKRYPALLRYVVEQTLEGRGDEIKERTIGMEVFGRAPDYDTNIDTVVRYSAGEVRKRLALHYHHSDAPLQISLTARSYKAEFLRVTAPPPVAAEPLRPPPPEAEPSLVAAASTPSRGRLSWLVAIVMLLVFAAVGARYAWVAHNDPLGVFWAPMIDQHSPAILSVGGVVFSQTSKIGTEVASDDAVINPYLSFENGLAMGRIAALINARGGSYRVQSASATTLAQIRDSPTILIGAYNNVWSRRLLEPLRFHFSDHPLERIIDSRDSGRFWQRAAPGPFGNAPDYAIVARFRSDSTGSLVIVAAGLQRYGTDAASQFLISKPLLSELDRRLGRDWGDKNIEAVLRVDVVEGRAGAPSIEALHVW